MPSKKSKTLNKTKVEKSESKEKQNSSWIISEAILFALASSSSYFLAFEYEKSYADYYGVPSDLIAISLNSVLLFFVAVSGLLLFLFYIFDILMMIFAKANPILLRAASPLFIGIVFLVIQLYFYGILEWQKWIVFPVFLVVLALLQFALPLVTQRKIRGYINKLKAQAKHDRERSDFTNLLRKLFGINGLVLILIFLLGSFIASSAGNAEAIRKSEFLVANTNPELIVLRVYDGVAIAAQFDRNTHEVFSNFSLISIKDNPQIIFSMEEIGPFRKSP